MTGKKYFTFMLYSNLRHASICCTTQLKSGCGFWCLFGFFLTVSQDARGFELLGSCV